MERRTTLTPDEIPPTKAKASRTLQRWVRNALLATLPFLGGDTPPTQLSIERADARTRMVTVQEAGIPGTLLEEQKLNPLLTEERYLALLTHTLTTPEKLHAYVRKNLRYIREEQDQDSWQSPEETLRKGGGDCEDFAFFGQEILRRQGKLAHVIALPGHAACVWVEKRPDGRYDVYTLDELGIDRNGKWEELSRSPHRALPKEEEGFTTPIEALNAALHKFDGEDTAPYAVHPYWIPVLRKIGPFRAIDAVTIHAFNPDAPLSLRISGVELAALIALLGGSYQTYRLLRRRGMAVTAHDGAVDQAPSL